MLEKILLALRIDDSLEEEVQELINACILDLKISGILESKILETDPLIMQAVKCYCRAFYTNDNFEADRFTKAYNLIVQHLAVCEEYKL